MNNQGTHRSALSISIDIGTTSSAVAVCYLRPDAGGLPLVTSVSRWPGQEESMYLEQVPTALMYSSTGQLIACGAQAYTHEMIEGIEEHGYQLVEHFKMHLHPNSVLQDGRHRLKPLPHGVRLLQVYTDFLAYLISETRRHLSDVTGSDPWPSVEDRVEILLTHPNRWGNQEQQFLEQAVVAAGIMPLDGALTRLKFAEESEAAASFCLPTAAISPKITAGTRFIICDAGGSTADVSAYKVKRTAEGTTFLKELDVPSCLDAGGVKVDNSLTQYIGDRIRASDEIDEEDIPWYLFDGLRNFQKVGKRTFSSPTEPCGVQIAGRRVNFTNPLVQRGIYTLKGADCERLFSPSVQLMVQAMAPYFNGRRNPTFLILTGGFGESPYVRKELTRIFGAGLVILSNPKYGKAVAIGGLRLITDTQNLYRIDRKERPWPTRVADFFSRFKNFAGL